MTGKRQTTQLERALQMRREEMKRLTPQSSAARRVSFEAHFIASKIVGAQLAHAAYAPNPGLIHNPRAAVRRPP